MSLQCPPVTHFQWCCFHCLLCNVQSTVDSWHQSTRKFSISPLVLWIDTNYVGGSRNDWAPFYIVCVYWTSLEAQVSGGKSTAGEEEGRAGQALSFCTGASCWPGYGRSPLKGLCWAKCFKPFMHANKTLAVTVSAGFYMIGVSCCHCWICESPFRPFAGQSGYIFRNLCFLQSTPAILCWNSIRRTYG